MNTDNDQQVRSNDLLGGFAAMLRHQIEPGHSEVIECRLGRDYAIALVAEIERTAGEPHAACVVGYTQGAYDYCDSHAQPDAIELNGSAVEHADSLFGMTPNTR